MKFDNVQYWISDLLKLQSHPQEVRSVCVMGVVVKVMAPAEDSKRPIGYYLDDGTGVIKGVHFVQKRSQNLQEMGFVAKLHNFAKLKRDLNIPNCDKLGNRLESLMKEAESPFPVGSCLEVKGKLQHYNSRAEILAGSVRKVTNGQDEIDRTLQMKHLRENVYPKSLFEP